MARSLFEGQELIGADTGKRIVVGDYLGGGGQGDVYKVSYAGEEKVLKWYRDPDSIPKTLHELLVENSAEEGSKKHPGPEYMWPIEVTEYSQSILDDEDGTREVTSFGYVMNLIPEGYYSFEEYLLTTQRFVSFRTAVDACLEVARLFRVLHNSGYCYQDLNAGNFFFEPSTGRVVICDCDNVAPHTTTTGIVGTPGFMAPELVIEDWECRGHRRKRRLTPSYKTDFFSMAVLFFEILTLTNPLEGSHSLMPQDDSLKAHLYGYDALFMFDPENHSNAPDDVVHINAIRVWNALPSYVRDVFTEAFSQSAIKNQNVRVDESTWLETLVRLRADIFKCPCGSKAELFVDSAKASRCDSCGRMVKPPLAFVFENGVRVPAVPGTRVYRIQLGSTDVGHELDPVGNVIARPNEPNNPRMWGIRNLSNVDFVASVPKSKAKKIAKPNDVIPFLPELTIETDGHKFSLDKN